MSTALPTRVEPSIRLEPVSLRNFRYPNYKAICGHCYWESFEYLTRDEAEAAGDHHSEICCDRINRGLALEVEVVGVLAQDLPHGSHILLKDLRTMEVENVEIFDDEVMVTYSIGDLASQILMLPLNHTVKVVA